MIVRQSSQAFFDSIGQELPAVGGGRGKFTSNKRTPIDERKR